jgi:MFS family permease
VAEAFGAAVWQIGTLLVVSGIVTAATQAALVPRVVARFGEGPMAVASQLGLAAGALGIVLAPAFWWLYPNTLLVSGVGGFFWATVGSLLAARVGAQSQGQLAGINTALQGLMAVVGPLVAGLAYDSVAPGAPFWLSGGLFLAAALLLVLRPRSQTVSEGPLPADA